RPWASCSVLHWRHPRVGGKSMQPYGISCTVTWIPASAGMTLSPRLHPRPQIHLVRPGALRLAVQLPIDLRDRLGIENAATILERRALGKIAADEFSIDGAVDHHVCDVDALGPQLPRHALGQRAQRVLRPRECREARATAHTCRGAREQDRAPAAG